MSHHYTRLQWKNGQPYSELYDDVFCSRTGGEAESQYVFIDANRLAQRFASQQHFCIAETGFGTGLNCLLAVQCFLQHADQDASLDFVSVEKHLLHPDDLAQCHADRPHLQVIVDELLRVYPPALTGMHRCVLFDGRIRLTLLQDDVCHALDAVDMQVDAWFLDGFAPSKNQAMWSQRVFDAMARCSHAQTSLSTYTVAGVVRRGLRQAGFDLQKKPGFGDKREMLVGAFSKSLQNRSQPPWFRLPRVAGGVKQAVIVGAGIAGLSTAWQLAQRGYRITLVDRSGQVASAASGNPAAIVMPRLCVDDALYNAFALQAHYFARQQYRRLQQSGDEAFWFESGVLTALQTHRADKLLMDAHAASAMLTRDIEHTPGDGATQWLFAQDTGWLLPPLVCRQILACCGDAVRLQQADVATLRSEQNMHALYDAQNRLIAETDCLILANAHDVNALIPDNACALRPSRGQISLVAEQHLTMRLDKPLTGEGYITPAWNGIACVGASYGDEVNMSIERLDHIDNIDRANRLLDRGIIDPVAKHNINGSVSFRAVTPDRLPVVGAVPDHTYFESHYHDLHHGRPCRDYPDAQYCKGLYVNTGYGSHGFSQAFLCAELLASMIDGTSLPVDMATVRRLLPARFLVRKFKRNRPLTDSV